MIGSLRGKTLDSHNTELLIEVGGIGYRIQVTPGTSTEFRVGDDAFLHIHHHVREDAELFYGFSSIDHRRVFETLIGTHGVGPALGLAILSVHEPMQLAEAVAADDVAALCLVPGVGRKTATRLLVELKSRLDVGEIDLSSISDTESTPERGALEDVREALTGLGYGSDEISSILPKLGGAAKGSESQTADSGSLLREALQILAAA